MAKTSILPGHIRKGLQLIKKLPWVNGTQAFICKCLSCGSKTTIDRRDFGTTLSCGCLQHLKGASNSCWSGYGDISGAKWSNIKNGAKDRKINFDIKIEYAWQLFLSQNKKCVFTGIELNFNEPTASLDRIDSLVGYIEGNIQWVHKDINKMKWNLSDQEFILWCKIIADYKEN